MNSLTKRNLIENKIKSRAYKYDLKLLNKFNNIDDANYFLKLDIPKNFITSTSRSNCLFCKPSPHDNQHSMLVNIRSCKAERCSRTLKLKDGSICPVQYKVYSCAIANKAIIFQIDEHKHEPGLEKIKTESIKRANTNKVAMVKTKICNLFVLVKGIVCDLIDKQIDIGGLFSVTKAFFFVLFLIYGFVYFCLPSLIKFFF